MKSSNINIFCQAPGDLIHSIALYDKYKFNSKITIYCINTKSTYEYFKSLKLKIKLVYIPYNIFISSKNPLSVFIARNKLLKLYNSHLLLKSNETVYFFSIWFDWITFYLIGKLSKENEIIYYSHYKSVSEIGKLNFSLKEKYQLYLHYLATGIKFKFTEETNTKRLLFLYKAFGIKKKIAADVNHTLLEPYLLKFNNLNLNSILLIESKIEFGSIFIDYKTEMSNLFSYLKKKGFKIYIKGHPRLGLTKELEKMSDYIIPNQIPSELLDIKKFSKIIGVDSYSLAYLSKIRHSVYSVINILSVSNKNEKNRIQNYLATNSDNKIIFPNKIDELCS